MLLQTQCARVGLDYTIATCRLPAAVQFSPMTVPLAPSDSEAVLLCQIPAMDGALLLRLRDRFQTPSAILQAPSSELRALGMSPGLVARIVAAPRQRAATEAGLRSLQRMGIRAV